MSDYEFTPEQAQAIKEGCQKIQEAATELLELMTPAAEELARIINTIADVLKPIIETAAEIIKRLWSAIVNTYPNKRVLYLATHGKQRTRKKNIARILKWIKEGGAEE